MESLEVGHKIAQIRGESGSSLTVGPINKIADDEVEFDVSVSSEWYSAKVQVQVSVDRLRSFMQQLDALISLSEKNINFINESGNFDLDLIATSTGAVEVKGIMSENMVDDLQLSFGFSSTLTDVDNFYRSLSEANVLFG